ncbi:MAG TPA: NAD-dependent epimerase/dehydratase family protein [Candidatus Solibacter sp.]|jgi:dTDP-L-rhamnose 4-epimerase|nr:NAD-dependent epimerase/dehydratase family protein [Candidatus Solibacter sp.]
MSRALVTGGAGLIGSHLVDLLLEQGWRVRILDALEPVTHRNGLPPWVPAAVEMVTADIRDRDAVARALVDVDVVFHQAAYGGYLPQIAKFIDVNCGGTAILLETIRDQRLPVAKVVVASSQAVYREGAVECAEHGLQFPGPRDPQLLETGDFEVRCPVCDGPTKAAPTPENAPTGGGNSYAISKVAEEQLALAWSAQTGIPAVALRYSCTYGPRQSIYNPYTGLIAIFATRLLAGLPPVVYEDGLQSRDLAWVGDVARANLLAAETSALDGKAVNIGSGRANTVREVARQVGDALGVDIEPELRGEFRPGEMRALTPDITLAGAAGYEPTLMPEEGIAHYVEWVRSQGDIHDYFASAERLLQQLGIVQRVKTPA